MGRINNHIIRRKPKVGKERRMESTLQKLTGNIEFPKPVHYEDIDRTVQEWVEKSIALVCDGVEVPTIKLFSNQRIGEYAQTWNMLDQNGNMKMNFKTITRDNNPGRGTIYKEQGNIPGNRQYLIGYKEVIQENGTIAYDAYSMKQPYAVNMVYKVGIITNKYELVNSMSEKMHQEFESIQKYVFPNGHAMSMILDSVTDASEGGVSDRKFYYQEFTVTMRAYIIDEKGFKITPLPNRANVYTTIRDGKRVIIKKPVILILSNNEESKSIIIDCSSSDKEITVEYEGVDTISITDIELSGVEELTGVSINSEPIDIQGGDSIVIEHGDMIHLEYVKDYNVSENTVTMTGEIESSETAKK